jgi:hypothetical protein
MSLRYSRQNHSTDFHKIWYEVYIYNKLQSNVRPDMNGSKTPTFSDQVEKTEKNWKWFILLIIFNCDFENKISYFSCSHTNTGISHDGTTIYFAFKNNNK